MRLEYYNHYIIMDRDNITHRPIEDVRNTVHSINRNINAIKIDMINIKSDLSIIKDYIRQRENEKEKEKEQVSEGWWWK